MELNNYQKQVMRDLSAYLNCVNRGTNLFSAWREYWFSKDVAVGLGGVPSYNNSIERAPHVCMKVPTGGGKTFLACASVRRIFDAMPTGKPQVVVWLVPSDSILTQTIRTLSNVDHPYRQRLDQDFAGRVGVYTKEMLLNGQNFSPDTVREMLTVCVMSYGSLRIDSRKKDVRKVYQENGNLFRFAEYFKDTQALLADTPDTALIQVLRHLEPVVIVDESHNAESKLSTEMLNNLNPSFVLDLTATPRKNSNIISYVDARELKKEHMVKLPVVVYNRTTRQSVIQDAIQLRGSIEQEAIAAEAAGGKYIRPIVLFQAQPRTGDNSDTFDKIKAMLVGMGIPKNQIAVKTSDVDDLKGQNLMSRDCEIRYIITVNALKEGWDCPFAYILASLANKTSQVDVEQILGRILRLPYTAEHKAKALNMSYVLTSSNDFNDTVQQIIRGLNSAGFSDRDYRLAEPIEPAKPAPVPEQLPMFEPETAQDDFAGLDGKSIWAKLQRRRESEKTPDSAPKADSMLAEARQAGDAYNQAVQGADNDPFAAVLPWEVRDKVNTFPIIPQYRGSVDGLLIPQFFQVIPQSLFTNGDKVLLSKEQLADGFTLKGKAYDIDFDAADDEIVKVDVASGRSVPRAYQMEAADQRYFKEYFSNLPSESRVRQCKDMMIHQLDKLNMVDGGDLRAYVNLIVDGMDREQLAAMEKAPLGFAAKIRAKIESLLDQHYKETFFTWLDRGKIVCEPSYRLPSAIHPTSSTAIYGKSLYEAEEGMNELEQELVKRLTAIPNVLWWHRNIARHGFAINGYFNHYPDIMIMTQSGKIILAETKGDHLKNDDSQEKIELGAAWRNAAGNRYRYYMVFQDEENLPHGAVSMGQFLETVEAL